MEFASLVRAIGRTVPESSICWFATWAGFGFLDPVPGSAYLIAGGSLRQRVAVALERAKERFARGRARLRRPRFPTFPLLDGGRSYLLVRGGLGDAIRLHRQFQFQAPNLWWPDDRTWFVHTEIDATSTYVGGSRALIDHILRDRALETFEVEASNIAGL